MQLRIRTVKPELFKHETLFDLEKEHGLPIRLAWVGLFAIADREGRFQWRPRTIKAELMPYDEVDFGRILDAFAKAGMIQKYSVGGEWFGVICSFKRHQVINSRESQSKLPAPPTDAPVQGMDMHVHAQGEGKGRELNGTEGKGAGAEPGAGGAGTSPPAAADSQKGEGGDGEEKPTVILQLVENESMEFEYAVEQWPITTQKDLLCTYTAASLKETIRRGIMALRQKHGVGHASKVPNLGTDLLQWVLREQKTLIKLSRGEQIKMTKHWDEQVTMGIAGAGA